MSEFQIDPRAELTAPEADPHLLPIVESPALSPAMAVLAAIEIEPPQAAAPEAKPVEPVDPVAPVGIKPNATQRFRAAAAAQIADARARLEQRNVSSVMALVLVASLAGGFGTVLANGAIANLAAPDVRIAQMQSMNDAIARIEDDIAALRGKVERSAEVNVSRADEATARIERIETAQAEPAAKLGKLAESVEKLRLAYAAMATRDAAASSDITGSIKSSAGGAKKLPIVEGWTLHEVDRDAALIEGKRGLFETYVGATIPGVGRVEGFRKQDGHWVVVTAKGLIVSR